MTKKEVFVDEISKMLEDSPEKYLSSDALDFWNSLQGEKKPEFTEGGKKVLKFIQSAKDEYNNLFKAKDIAERIGTSSRAVTGSIRKLVIDGYVEKVGKDPVVYSITEKGLTARPDEEQAWQNKKNML